MVFQMDFLVILTPVQMLCKPFQKFSVVFFRAFRVCEAAVRCKHGRRLYKQFDGC